MVAALIAGLATTSLLFFATLLCYRTGAPLSGLSPGEKAERLLRAVPIILLPSAIITGVLVHIAGDSIQALATDFVEKSSDRLPVSIAVIGIAIAGITTVLFSYVPLFRNWARHLHGGKSTTTQDTPVGDIGQVVKLNCGDSTHIGIISAWIPDSGTVALRPTFRQLDAVYEFMSSDELFVPLDCVASHQHWSVEEFVRRFEIRDLVRPAARWEDCLTAEHRQAGLVETCRVDQRSSLDPAILVEFSCSRAGRWTLRANLRRFDGRIYLEDLCGFEVPDFVVGRAEPERDHAATVLRDDQPKPIARFVEDFAAAESDPMQFVELLPDGAGQVLATPRDTDARVRVLLHNIYVPRRV